MEKAAILRAARTLVEEQLGALQSDLSDLRSAVENEGKSSAGDKHETSRAMMDQEIVQIEQRILISKKHLNALQSISGYNSRKVENGALVTTENGTFLICAPLGKIIMEEETIFAISPSAPLVQAMLGLENGDVFTFQGKKLTIGSIH